MKMYLDSAVGKIELEPDFFVRRSYQKNDLAFALGQPGLPRRTALPSGSRIVQYRGMALPTGIEPVFSP
jgi:hypothetical protein